MFASSPIFLSYAVLVKVHDHIVALVDRAEQGVVRADPGPSGRRSP